MTPITLTVPMPPNIANRPMHHMVKHRVKVGYWALLDLMYSFGYDAKAIGALDKIASRTRIKDLAVQIRHAQAYAADFIAKNAGTILFGPKSAAPPAWPRASIRSVMHLGAPMDIGNAMNRHKFVEDWLVTRGFIADDTADALQWEGFPEQHVKRDGNYRIELVLTPL